MKPLTAQLAEAERHVDQAQKRIEDQLLLIERLREDGHDVTEAERLLATFLGVMETFTEHRDQIAEQLFNEKHSKSSVSSRSLS